MSRSVYETHAAVAASSGLKSSRQGAVPTRHMRQPLSGLVCTSALALSGREMVPGSSSRLGGAMQAMRHAGQRSLSPVLRFGARLQSVSASVSLFSQFCALGHDYSLFLRRSPVLPVSPLFSVLCTLCVFSIPSCAYVRMSSCLALTLPDPLLSAWFFFFSLSLFFSRFGYASMLLPGAASHSLCCSAS